VGDGPPGDALIEISVLPHPYFTRKATTSIWICRSP